MKIYAIRDRMLDYFQPPVCVHRGEDLLAAISKGINGPEESRNEIAQAPDHYELWRIGNVDDQGNITPEREFIINCASLVRDGVWKRQPGSRQLEREAPRDTRPDPGTPSRPTNGNSTQAVQDALDPKGTPPGAPEAPTFRGGRIPV